MLDPNNSNDLKLLEKCREINKEIINFGVNDKEIIKLIELLSFELEDTSLMRSIHSLLKSEPEDIKKENIVIWKVINMSADLNEEDFVPSDISEFYGKVKLLIESMEEDVLKANKGNKAAGVRLRKSLRYLKSVSGDFVKFTLSK
mgnify:CR=1 FL=1